MDDESVNEAKKTFLAGHCAGCPSPAENILCWQAGLLHHIFLKICKKKIYHSYF